MQAVAEKLNGVAAQHREAASAPLRLNIGGGADHLDGFTTVDRKAGSEAYPLDYPDGSAESIYASHILEHFCFLDVEKVLRDWVRVLKPGGKIQLAVPDFEYLVRAYLNGEPFHLQGYVLGGHTDSDDRHGALFDRDTLTELMLTVGLERIGPWKGSAESTAAMPFSLNLQAFKPSGPALQLPLSNVRACVSVPRFGPLMHPKCTEKAFMQLGLQGTAGQSCFWAQKICELMEEAIEDPACEFVLTSDYDTVFSADDVKELYRLLRGCPDVDCVFPMQAKRGCTDALFSLPGPDGQRKLSVTAADLTRHLLPANTGHFGLTLFRADSLRKFPRPWMLPVPNERGRWDGGHVDPDIDFWRRFREAGLKVCLAPRVVVGHLEEVVSWPGPELQRFYQTTADYESRGIPPEVQR